MDDSDDYIPNAEDNLSILSDADKSSGHSEIDLEEINDVLLQNLESDVCAMHNEVKRRDCEMQNLIEDIKLRFYAEKDAEYAPIIRKYERKLHDIQEKNYELEESLKYEKSQSAKYLAVVETLESECEKLRLETHKQQAEIFALNDKILKINAAALNRSTANSSIMHNGPPSPIAAGPSGFNKNFIADRSRNMVLDTQEDCSVDFDATGFLKLGDYNKESEEVWASKLDFFKEKLTNEQNRSRELEFMIATQKNLLESTNENIAKLKQENKQLESKNDKLSTEIDKVEQTRKIEKTKIDSVITFCELMDNCVFPKAEMLEKLSELPFMIASYLKGLTDTITFNRSQNSNSKLLAAAKKVKSTLTQLDEGNEKADRNYRAGLAANELDEIRHGISSLTQFLSKALPNTVANDTSMASDSPSNRSFSKMDNFKFCNKTDRQHQDLCRPNNFKTSYLFAKAMQSGSLLWNLNQQRAATRGSSEGH